MCWLKDDFIEDRKEGDVFVQALPKDNPFLPDDYIDNLRSAWSHRPDRVQAYVEGNWDVLAADDVIIKPSWVNQAVNKEILYNYNKVLVSCDPARYGVLVPVL